MRDEDSTKSSLIESRGVLGCELRPSYSTPPPAIRALRIALNWSSFSFPSPSASCCARSSARLGGRSMPTISTALPRPSRSTVLFDATSLNVAVSETVLPCILSLKLEKEELRFFKSPGPGMVQRIARAPPRVTTMRSARFCVHGCTLFFLG